MKSFFPTLIFFLLNPFIIMAASPFAGEDWTLVETLDKDSNAIAIPQGTFKAKIVETDDSNLRMVMKIGNNMRTQITLKGGDSPESQQVEFGGVMSTMMMPKPDVWALEKYLSKVLPRVTKMDLVDGTLLLTGDMGTVKYTSS
jgi:hypothetical protein